MLRPLRQLRRAVWKAVGHDVLTQSKAAAYSAILGLFPAVLVVTTLLAFLPRSGSLVGEMRSALVDFLPDDTMSAVHAYFHSRHGRSLQAILSAVLVSLFGNMGVMTSFMEGFRRAYGLERGGWSFRRERLIALGLIPSCLFPMACATVFVAFGHQIERWVIENSDHIFRTYLIVLWRVARWMVALATTSTVLAVIYRYGIPRPRAWRFVMPGAMSASVIWFLATLSYGWYITRFADYSVVYGPFGTAIATLVWLYITSLSVFIGAEFNAQVFPIAAGSGLGASEEESLELGPELMEELTLQGRSGEPTRTA